MGWASAPYDPHWEDRHPARAALMSAAGPVANLVLASLALAGLGIGLASGLFHYPDTLAIDRLVNAAANAPMFAEGLGRLLSVLLSLNLLLFVFNLAPFPPLDGAAVLTGLVPALRRLSRRQAARPRSGQECRRSIQTER